MEQQAFQCIVVHRKGRSTHLRRVEAEEVVHEYRDLLAAFPKRWDIEPKDVQSVEQVFAEVAILHKPVDVGVRGGDDPDVGFHWPGLT